MVEEFIAETLRLGFDLDDVRGPVSLWWGGRDPLVHPAHAQILTDRLNCVSIECSECEHELAIWHWKEILERVSGVAR